MTKNFNVLWVSGWASVKKQDIDSFDFMNLIENENVRRIVLGDLLLHDKDKGYNLINDREEFNTFLKML